MAKPQKRQESILQGVYTDPESSGENIEALRMVLYGWDYTNSVWRRVSVDENGTVQTNGAAAATTDGYWNSTLDNWNDTTVTWNQT